MIQQLEQDKHVLAAELESTRTYLAQLLRKDGEWQEKTCTLEKELQESRSSVDQLETELGRATEGITAAMTVLRSCQHSKEDSTSLESNDEKP
jgi:predicted RNase H-like nuclease (RuvC/YqgF family)